MNKNNIKPQELRLGNYFKDREDRVCRVEQISIEEGETKIRAIKSGMTSLPVEPIPLSEEVLLRCPQLEQTHSGFFFRNEFINIELTTRGYCRISVSNNPIKLYFLHELQNVYPWFANRQELEVRWT